VRSVVGEMLSPGCCAYQYGRKPAEIVCEMALTAASF
jgi:hypothetical protein